MNTRKISVSPRVWNGYVDVVDGVKEWRLWLFLGYLDIRQRYVRSMLGPLWMVMGLGVTVLGIGILYGEIFKSSPGEFMPFIAISLAAWNFISATINESTSLFQAQASLLKSISVPYTTVVLRNLVKNVIVFLHYLVAVAITFAVVGSPVNWMIITVIPAVVLTCANLYWFTLIVAMICARFRDMAQIVLYGVQIAMFVTPIVWMPKQVRMGSPFIVYNPLNHLIELIRAPVFEHRLPLESYGVCLAMFVVGAPLTILAFNKFKRSIGFWI